MIENESGRRPTSFKSKCRIVAQFWMEFRDDEEFAPFFEEHDLGFPLAFAIYEGMVTPEADGKNVVRDTFADILLGFGIKEDTGFKQLSDFVREEDLQED